VETDAVLAFIRGQQSVVLENAIDQLSTCTPDELRPVVHAIYGTLGSYRLTTAHEAVSAFSVTLNSPGSTPSDIEEARASTVETLRAAATEVAS